MNLLESDTVLSADSNSDSDKETAVEVPNKSIVKPLKSKIYESVPLEKITLKMFQRIRLDVSREFNVGNLQGIASLINKSAHNRMLFRLQSPAETEEFVGTDSIISFYGNLLQVYPDAIILTKKVKTFNRAQFYVIEEKVEFTGTQFSKDLSIALLCPNQSSPVKHQADYMTVSEEEKRQFRELEDAIMSCGRNLQIFNKAVMTHYIDLSSNRIVLSDLKYKVTNIRAV